MPPRTRRTASIGVALAALALTSACGGGSSAGTVTTSASTSASAPASTSAGGTNHFAPGSSVDAASVRQMFTAALATANTVHVTMTATGVIAMSGRGDLDLTAKPLRASLELTSPQLSATGGDTARMLLVDNAMYVQLAALGQKYVKAPLDDTSSPLGSLGLDALDPGALFDKFGDAVTGGTYIGKDTIDGTATDHYRVTIDGARVASALPSLPGSSGRPSASALPATQTVDVWFDDAGRYRQMTMKAGGEDITEVFSDWGKKVAITAPPASQVTDLGGLSAGS
jgi:hypothetical protein